MNWIMKHLDLIDEVCAWIALICVGINIVVMPCARFAWLCTAAWIVISRINRSSMKKYEKMIDKLICHNIELLNENYKLKEERKDEQRD